MNGLALYNVSLVSNSPFFTYTPNRDGDPSVTWNSSYTESPTWPSVGNRTEPRGTPYRRTWATGTTVQFNYLGSDIYLCFDSGGSTIHTLTIDGIAITEMDVGADPACSDYPTGTTLLRSSGISKDNHQAVLKVTASQSREFRFYGAVITMGVTSGRYCELIIHPSVQRLTLVATHDTVSLHVAAKEVDDLDDGWTMVPGRKVEGSDWQSGPDQASSSLIANGHSWTCTYDPQTPRSASYKFSGAGGVILRGTIGEGLQAFSVDFDGQHVPLDATSVWPDPRSAVLFMQGGLDPKKTYSIKLTNYNKQYTTCEAGRPYYFSPSLPQPECCMNLDGLVLLGDGDGTPPTQPAPTNSSTPLSSPTPFGDTPDDIPSNPNPAATRSHSHVGSRVGAAVGAVAAIAALAAAGVIYFRFWRKRHSRGAVISALTITSRPQIAEAETGSSGEVYPSVLLRRKLHSFGDGARGPSTPTPDFSPAASVDSMDPTRIRSTRTLGSRQAVMSREILDEIVLLVEERMSTHVQAQASSPSQQNVPGETTTMLPAYRG